MKNNCIAPDKDILNIFIVQRLNEIPKVIIENGSH